MVGRERRSPLRDSGLDARAPSGDAMTYSNVESQAQAFVTFVLAPYLRAIEEALTLDGEALPPGAYCHFSVDGLLRADSTGRAAFYTAALGPATGRMGRQEVRELEDLPAEDARRPQAARA